MNHIVAGTLLSPWPKDAHVAEDDLLAACMQVSSRRLPSAKSREPVQSAFTYEKYSARIDISNSHDENKRKWPRIVPWKRTLTLLDHRG